MVGTERLDQVIGKDFLDFVRSEDRERFWTFIQRVCAGETSSLEYSLLRLDETFRVVETRAVPLLRRADVTVSALGVTQDISGRKQLEPALSECGPQLEAESRDRRLREQIELERDELRKALADAEARHRQLSEQAVAEREALKTTLRGARGPTTPIVEERGGRVPRQDGRCRARQARPGHHKRRRNPVSELRSG